MKYINILLTWVVLFGCYNDTEEQLYGVPVCNLEDVTYSNHVASILSNSCYACHGKVNATANGAGIVLEGYERIRVDILVQSVVISNSLFRSARADYLEVLLTQREALESKMELVEIKQKQLNAKVNIYRALGGGWNAE